MNKAEIGICKIEFDGVVYHKNALARQACQTTKGNICPLFKTHFSTLAKNHNQMSTTSVIHKLNEYVSAVTLRVSDGYRIFFHAMNQDSIFKEVVTSENLSSLSNSEEKILKLILSNRTNQEMAEILFVSKETVKTHLSHIYQKIPALKGWRRRR